MEGGVTQRKQPQENPGRFSVTLDPIQGALHYAKIADEIVALLAARPGTRVQIKLDISASDPAGYDEQTRRAVKENAKTLKFDQLDFE